MANFYANKNKMIKTKVTRSAGSVRQNQLITSFGVGSIVDFVSDTVMIAGTDDWDTSETYRIYNENLQSLAGVEYFVRPKTDPLNDKPYAKSNDIPSYIFPEKLWCTKCNHIVDVKSLENQKDPHKCIYCGSKTLVASRFIIACENGHIEDFPYHYWVHKGKLCPSNQDTDKIIMYNADNRSGIDSLMLKCEHCGTTRRLEGAFSEYSFSGDNGYKCNSNYPHLKNPKHFSDEVCNLPMKAVLRSSSSVYFPVSISALSIPPWSKEAVKIVLSKYSDISLGVEGRDEVSAINYLKKFFNKYVTDYLTQTDFLKAYDVVKNNKHIPKRTQRDIYEDEYIELCKGNCDDETGDFTTFTAEIPTKFKELLDKIVIVERLTEVQALYGFTRISPFVGALDNARIAPLSMNKKEWIPAVELKGEGIFIKFNKQAIKQWKSKVGKHYDMLSHSFNESYFENMRFSNKTLPSNNEYVLLHSFSHLIMRQISMDCGYNIASLKEKIYSTFIDEEKDCLEMCGVLIYLTSADADGSLGGLTSIGANKVHFEKIIMNALRKAQWCSADPLCITSKQQGFSSLNYSACHDCLLIPETSCEFRNILLDRGSLIGTSENSDIGYFKSVLK